MTGNLGYRGDSPPPKKKVFNGNTFILLRYPDPEHKKYRLEKNTNLLFNNTGNFPDNLLYKELALRRWICN